jgi:transcriptional regulator with XRE-family HTH domain
MAGTRRVSNEDREIAAGIRSARVASGATQRELARALGVSVQQVTKYENAESRVPAGRLLAIARALEVSVIRLVSVEGAGSPVTRVRATAQLFRDFCTLDADLQDVVIKVVAMLAPGARLSSQPGKPRRPRS